MSPYSDDALRAPAASPGLDAGAGAEAASAVAAGADDGAGLLQPASVSAEAAASAPPIDSLVAPAMIIASSP